MTERIEGRQNAIVHEGVSSGDEETNDGADDAVEIQQPDGSEAPRAPESSA